MTTVLQLVGWDEAKCRPIYRHRQAPLPSLEQQQHQSSFVDINIHPPIIKRSSSLVVSRKKNKNATKIAMNTAVADSSSHDVVVPARRKRGDRAISNSSNRQHHERVSLSPPHNNIIVTDVNHATSLLHHRLFNNNNNDNNNSNNNNYYHRVSLDAATRWTKTKRRYGKNNMGVSSNNNNNNNNNNNMSHTHEMLDDVIFVIDDSFAILPPAAAVVNCNDDVWMMMEDEEGGEDLVVFNENNDGREEGRATTIDESSNRSATSSSSLLHGNRDGVGEDCDDRHRRRKISHSNIQPIHREIDPLLMVDHPLHVDEYHCELDHPDLDEVTNSKNDDVVEFPEIVQHADELVITTPSSKKQLGEEQRQLTDSFSNENESEEDDERYYYELDEYDTPSIFNPQLHNTAILTQDDDENTAVIDSTGFDDHFAIDETGSTTSRIHPSKGERRRGSTYGDGKPVWTSSKLISSSESLNGPRGKIIVGWDDDKGRPIYRTTACESNSLSTNNIDDPCLLPSTRSLNESEVKNSTIPKQKQKKKKKVYATLFKKTGLSQAVRDEMDIDPPSSPLLDDPPPPACRTTVVTEYNIQTIDVGLHSTQILLQPYDHASNRIANHH